MRRLRKVIIARFNDWALNHIQGVFSQYGVVSLFEFFNHVGWFDGLLSMMHMPILSQVLDGLWWVDMAYVIASIVRNLIGHRPQKRQGY